MKPQKNNLFLLYVIVIIIIVNLLMIALNFHIIYIVSLLILRKQFVTGKSTSVIMCFS